MKQNTCLFYKFPKMRFNINYYLNQNSLLTIDKL